MVVLVTSRGWPRVVTSNMLSPAPKSKFENLMGFFSSVCGDEAGATAADMTRRVLRQKGALTKGRGCFFAEGWVLEGSEDLTADAESWVGF